MRVAVDATTTLAKQRWSNGFVRKRIDKGRWQLISSMQIGGRQVSTSKMSGVMCEPNSNKGKGNAMRELAAWVQQLNQDPLSHLSAKWLERLSRIDDSLEETSMPETTRGKTFLKKFNSQSLEIGTHAPKGVGFVDFMAMYYRRKKIVLNDIEESTYADYQRLTGKAREFFGDTDLRDVTRQLLQDYIVWLVEHGLSPYTVWRHVAAVTQVARYAWAQGMLVTNQSPTEGLKKPKKVKQNPSNPISLTDIAMTWNKLCSVRPSTNIVEGMKIMLVCGLRTAEVCGLMWQHIVIFPKNDQGQETGGYLAVVQSVAKGEHGYYIKVPKTKRGKRVAYFGAALAKSLRAWRNKCLDRAFELGVVTDGNDPLAAMPFVCGIDNGHYMEPHTFSRKYSVYSQALSIKGIIGAPTKAYDFRRSNAGILNLSPDADPKSITEMFGHSSIDFTREVYVSADPVGLNKTAGAVDDLVSGRTAFSDLHKPISLDAFPTAIKERRAEKES